MCSGQRKRSKRGKWHDVMTRHLPTSPVSLSSLLFFFSLLFSSLLFSSLLFSSLLFSSLSLFLFLALFSRSLLVSLPNYLPQLHVKHLNVRDQSQTQTENNGNCVGEYERHQIEHVGRTRVGNFRTLYGRTCSF